MSPPRDRLSAARDALQRSQTFADALQSQINGLYTNHASGARVCTRNVINSSQSRDTWRGHLRGLAAFRCRSHSIICFSTFAMQSAQIVCVIAASAVEPT
jgi:hypothetical protein